MTDCTRARARERERERERERQRESVCVCEREGERQRDRERGRDTERHFPSPLPRADATLQTAPCKMSSRKLTNTNPTSDMKVEGVPTLVRIAAVTAPSSKPAVTSPRQ
jgi:hypothetical protein